MIAAVKCPACRYEWTIPEGEMGSRHVCPNCQSPFLAGRSVTITGSDDLPPSSPGYVKTMIGDTMPSIKYNCPRCKKSLEAMSSEAGTKKPCPGCGQRVQVPAAPPPALAAAPAAAAHPSLNRTMVGSDESMTAAPPIRFKCPNCKKAIEAPAIEAGMKRPCPSCGQRLLVPAAPPRPRQLRWSPTSAGPWWPATTA